MKNKLLCLDVDGTIVARNGYFFDGVIDFCSSISNAGWNIALCSARPIVSLQEIAGKLDGISWICGLGGMIIANRINTTWKILYQAPFLNENSTNQILYWAESHNQTDVWAYDACNWFVTKKSDRVQREQYIIGQKPFRLSLFDIGKIPLLKLVFPHITLEVFPLLSDTTNKYGLLAQYSTDTQVEISSAMACDKGLTVLQTLLPNCGKIVALGDGANDIGMLNAADIGMTFADGNIELQNIANHVLSKDRSEALKQVITVIKRI